MLGFRMVIWSSISLLDIVDNGKEVGEFLFLENIVRKFEQRKIVIFFQLWTFTAAERCLSW